MTRLLLFKKFWVVALSAWLVFGKVDGAWAVSMDFFVDWYKVTVTQNDTDWSIKVLNTDLAYDSGKAASEVRANDLFGGSVFHDDGFDDSIVINLDGSKDYIFESPSFFDNIIATIDKRFVMNYQLLPGGTLPLNLGSELFTVSKTLTIYDDVGPHNVSILVGNYLGTGTYESQNPVPEPATMLLFGTGIVGLISSRIRRKKAN